MDRAELGQKLSSLQRKYNAPPFSDAIKNNITIELQCVLQDYLWEGEGFKTFSRQKYRQLALAWHTDKLKNLKESPQLSEEAQFLLWYAKRVKGNDNAPFQAINAVQEKYRPELRFRQQDTSNTGERFYFFGSFPQFFPHTYNILWPFFYLLEALERNIDNYQNATVREWAKTIYALLSLVPGATLVGLLAIMGMNGGIDLLLTLSDLLGGSWLSSMIYSAVATGLTAMMLYGVCALYLIITNNTEFNLRRENLTDNLLFELPFQALREVYRNKNFTQLGLLSGVLLTQVLVCTIGFLYAWPFLKMLCAFPLVGLLLVNAPLLARQCYDNPRAAINIVKEYGFTICNRYASLLKAFFAFAMHFWPRQQTPANDTAHQPEPEQTQQPQQALPAPTHYWHQKWTKYLTKNLDDLRQKRRQLKQKRNEMLTHFRIDENHGFYERLEQQLGEKSILTDENGGIIDSDESQHENTTEALTVLNLKMQNLLLTQAQQKNMPFHQLQAGYPNNLDYHSLKEKGNIEFSFSSSSPRMNRK